MNITLSSGDVVQGYTQTSVNLTKAFVRSFRGIKFGEAARWMPPNFTAFLQYMSKDGIPINGPACPWITNMNNESFDPPFNKTNMALAFDYATSEDCLNLNVFTPVSKPKEPLPVVIWLHGGSNGVTGPAGRSRSTSLRYSRSALHTRLCTSPAGSGPLRRPSAPARSL